MLLVEDVFSFGGVFSRDLSWGGEAMDSESCSLSSSTFPIIWSSRRRSFSCREMDCCLRVSTSFFRERKLSSILSIWA